MIRSTHGLRGRSIATALGALGLAAPVLGQARTYTDDADFDEGILTQVNHDPPNQDQLQLDEVDGSVSFLAIALSGRGTVIRLDTETGAILGEYRTAPQGFPTNPSRATVDANGDVWAGNRDDSPSGQSGSVVKVGIVIGGTRVDASGTPDPTGGYLAPPFAYSTAVDRDGDGLIRTSMGGGDVLAWVDVTDGMGGASGGPALVQDAEDEAILVYQRTDATQNRQISFDGAGDVWVGGYPQSPNQFDVLDPTDGSIQGNLQLGLQCGGFAGEFDGAGVLWSSSFFEDTLMRHDPVGGTVTCIPTQLEPSGVLVDASGAVWVAGGSELRRFDGAGNPTGTFPIAGSAGLFAIAQHPVSGELWVTDFDNDLLFRVDTTGALLASTPVGGQPSGVAVDAAGMVWVTNNASDDAMRVDPATDMVDLTVSLGAGAQPFNPSRMDAFVSADGLAPLGTWEVVHDGGAADVDWTQVSWNSSELAGSTIEVEVRAANSPAALGGQAFVSVVNGGAGNVVGRFLEVRATFRTADGTTSPILFDLTVDGEVGPTRDCVEYDRRRPSSLLLFPEFDSRPGVLSLVTVTHVDCGGEAIDVEYVYVEGDECSEFNRTERFTPCDTLTAVVGAHDPNQTRGYLYCFAKDAATGEPIAADVLIGQMLIVDGIDRFEYSTNAVGFFGVGGEGTTDVDGDGRRDLDGVEYSEAADEFLVPRFIGQTTEGPQCNEGRDRHGELVLVDLTGGSDFTTVLDFLIYNDNEEVFSGEHSFECWERVRLTDISGVFGEEFLHHWTSHDPNESVGGFEAGWFRVDALLTQSSWMLIEEPAVQVLYIERVANYAASDLPFEVCSQPGGSLLPRGDTNGF